MNSREIVAEYSVAYPDIEGLSAEELLVEGHQNFGTNPYLALHYAANAYKRALELPVAVESPSMATHAALLAAMAMRHTGLEEPQLEQEWMIRAGTHWPQYVDIPRS